MKNLYSKLFGTTSDPMPSPDTDIARDFAKVETDINEALQLNDALDKTGKKYRDLYSAEARKNAHLLAEAAIVQASFATTFRVVRGMDMEWGFPAAELADRVALDEKVVRSVLRALEANGLAKRHPFFSEDTHLINGSGYSLTAAGEKLRTMLPADPAPVQLPIAA